MIVLKHPVIVEGKYDKIRLSSLVDAPIFTTDGFGIFRDREKKELIRRLCERAPVIVLTDSDKGGALIRRALKGIVPAERLIHVYIPKLKGKERRKSAPSKEGYLGVEGMSETTLLELFRRSGLEADVGERPAPFLNRARLYADGLMGLSQSGEKRKALAALLDIPAELSTTAFVEAVNLLCGEEEYERGLQRLREEQKEETGDAW